MRRIIGIVGTLGAGKTTVARMFGALGAEVLDADILAHEAVGPEGECRDALLLEFGTTSRDEIAAIAFPNMDKLKKLNAIVHPAVIRRIKAKIAETQKGILIIDAPLLLEAGLLDSVDSLIVVKSDFPHREYNFADERIRAQIPIEEKLKEADYVIENNSDMDELRRKVEEIYKKINARI